MSRVKTAVLVLTMACLSLVMSCTSSAHQRIKVRRISDRVIVVSCMQVNVTAIKGDRGLVIIDTNRSPSVMKEIWSRIEKEFRTNKVLRVINTHGHRDHASGNQIFPASIIVGQENCPEFMRRTNSLAAAEQDEGFVLTVPTRTFRDTATFDAGRVIIRMYYAGNAHTNHDIFVHVPSEKVLLLGDLFGKNSRSFEVNRLNDIPRVISLLDKFSKDGGRVEYAVPGHGENILTAKDLAETKLDLEKEFGELDPRRSAALTLSQLLANNDAARAVVEFEKIKGSGDTNLYFLEDEFRLAGWHLLWRGEMDKAVGAFQATARQYPGSALAFLDLAEAFLRRGDVDSAVVNYERSLEIFPDNKPARKILDRLRSSR